MFTLALGSLAPTAMNEIQYLNVSFFFQAEDGIRDLVRSRGLGDVIRDRTTGVSIP